MGNVTRFLVENSSGNASGTDQLVEMVYPELRRIAHNHMSRERKDHTLNTTAIVNEAYLALVDQSLVNFRDRAHFFAAASKIMRNILVDYARRRVAQKRGGDQFRVEFTENLSGQQGDFEQLLQVDEALSALAKRDSRMEMIVECRFFGGMSVRETAEILDLSHRTVERDWTRAKAYLYQILNDESDG